ncbi:MAG: hypothetical protein F9K23_13020 [Bacteroidetes bacterium]|nr:MAG: hypothetical protein F9K23_13020 [Bacteroidota bacterium]
MNTIIKQYNLAFSNVITNGKNYKQCFAPDATLAADIAYHLSGSFDEGHFMQVLKEIDRALTNQAYQREISFNDTSVEITTTNVTINDVYTIPINDYKRILEEWINFLKTPPLNFQKM